MKKLLSYGSLVESPMIVVRIGEYTFGQYSKKGSLGTNSSIKVTYPNYMQSVNVTKIAGAVNNYTISMVYAITQGNDPNLLEKVFSSVANDRKLYITYGDCASPNFVFREEEATILKVSSSIDVSGSRISYNITCVSSSLQLSAGRYDFPALNEKPSDVIRRLLNNNQYGIKDLFYGMKRKDLVDKYSLILSDDKRVRIEAKRGVSILDYLNFLVSCMESTNDKGSDVIQGSRYYLTIIDDIQDEFNGPYFKIHKVKYGIAYDNSLDAYEVDIGYPSENLVTGFSVDNNDLWSILYDYSEKVNKSEYVYKIDNKGNLVTEYSPNITTSTKYNYTTQANKAWWTQVTKYPINATLTIKGLLSPVILMSYIRVNVYFYGSKHISSGLYVVTKQVDNVDSSGYKTTLTLMRVGGDNNLAVGTSTEVN